jgi:hypothetical protein
MFADVSFDSCGRRGILFPSYGDALKVILTLAGPVGPA